VKRGGLPSIGNADRELYDVVRHAWPQRLLAPYRVGGVNLMQ
jgi:hypothetical protein